MKVLITGHCGFIGKNLYKYISENTDWKVDGFEWCNKHVFPRVDGYDWVIHLGAISSTTERDVDKVMSQNYEFSQKIFKECTYHGVNLQYASSASVYGLLTNFNEDAPKDPRSAYAWSKYLFDRWMQQELPFTNIKVQGFRYFNVYGEQEGHKGNMASPVTKFFKQAKEKGMITAFEQSENYRRDFVWVGDLCRAHVRMINEVNKSGIWNMGTGRTASFKMVADAISQKMDVPVVEVPMPSELKGQYQEYTQADMTKFNLDIGFFAWRDIIEWINETDPQQF